MFFTVVAGAKASASVQAHVPVERELEFLCPDKASSPCGPRR
jgi:hypothetical protein